MPPRFLSVAGAALGDSEAALCRAATARLAALHGEPVYSVLPVHRASLPAADARSHTGRGRLPPSRQRPVLLRLRPCLVLRSAAPSQPEKLHPCGRSPLVYFGGVAIAVRSGSIRSCRPRPFGLPTVDRGGHDRDRHPTVQVRDCATRDEAIAIAAGAPLGPDSPVRTCGRVERLTR